MTTQEQIKKRKNRAETSKRKLIDDSLSIIRENPSSLITDEEWNDINYAITRAIDKAFDIGVRFQKSIQYLKEQERRKMFGGLY